MEALLVNIFVGPRDSKVLKAVLPLGAKLLQNGLYPKKIRIQERNSLPTEESKKNIGK